MIMGQGRRLAKKRKGAMKFTARYKTGGEGRDSPVRIASKTKKRERFGSRRKKKLRRPYLFEKASNPLKER